MYNAGSEWRRWDLHVHTPDTALNNQFKDWSEYIDALGANADVPVIGITDYLSITNYSRLRRLWEQGRFPHVELLVPNIEFRLSPSTNRETAVNIHLLVSPDETDHEKQILNALGRLCFQYGTHKYSCLPDQLIDLGRAFDPRNQDDKTALSCGTNQFKIGFSGFREWLEQEPWLMKHSLVAVAAGSDGLSGYDQSGGFAAYREEIARFSHIIFSGRPGERDFWLGRSNHAARCKELGGPKPCLHGSDAHRMESLFHPDQGRFCWVKADPTFEGLRQTLYEPGDRVHIGTTKPVYHDHARTLKSVSISDANGWFQQLHIPLNAGLISLIGQKGSGKSALAELIAYASGHAANKDKASFIDRAGAHIRKLKVTLAWGDRSTSVGVIGTPQLETSKVRYLSQSFVERLCAQDTVGTELLREIEAVIFSRIDPTDTLNASTFEELRTIRTRSIKAHRDELREDLTRLLREDNDLLVRAATVPEKKLRIKSLRDEREGLVKQLPLASNASEQILQDQFEGLRGRLVQVQASVAAHKQRLQKLEDVRGRLLTFNSQASRFHAEMIPLLAEIGVGVDEYAYFRPAFPLEADGLLTVRERWLRIEIDSQEGERDAPALGTLRWIERQLEDLSQQESADKIQKQQSSNVQTRVSTIDAEIIKIESEIAKIEGDERARRVATAEDRQRTHRDIFATLKKEQEFLESLYKHIKPREGVAEAYEQDLTFSIRWDADIARWLDRGSVLFDQRKSLPFGSLQGIREAAERLLLPVWTSGDPASIEPAMTSFLDEFAKQDFKVSNTYLRANVTRLDLFTWLYEVDHISLRYGLKYKGTELEKLSPGTKGIVLLILYLGMDTDDTRPLIVDQPDENLDNESVYSVLTTYFRAAKSRRQVLLITHNPNLVVNGDAEQVIVASCEKGENGLPRIEYVSGSLENSSPSGPNIRHQVCTILEGGDVAFRNRERRYSLSGS